MFNNPIFDITKGISSLYISGKKRKHSEILKKPDGDISNKFKDLKDKFKDLASLYDELEEQLGDVHFMNLSNIKNYRLKPKQKSRIRNIPNSQKNFNYNYNNLNDYYYSLYKKLTNKKQKISSNDEIKDKEEENIDAEINRKRQLYNIDNEISLNFSDTKLNSLGLNSNSNNKINDNSNNNNNNNDNNNNNNSNSNNNIYKNSRPKKTYRYNYIKNEYSSKQNNFIPSGIKIPKKFENTHEKINTSNETKNKDQQQQPPQNSKLNNIKEKNVPIPTLNFISLKNISDRTSNSFFNNLSRSSIVSSNSDTIKDNINERRNKKRHRENGPYIPLTQSLNLLENLSNSQFLEDLNDYVEKVNEDNNIYSTCSKLNTIPYHSFQTQNDLINLMNESKSKSVNYLKLYSSKSIRTSSSDFVVSSSESVKDKSDCVIWNKDLNINNYNNNYYKINPQYLDEESDPFENISDLSVSSDERKQHLSINNINENKKEILRHHHHHHSQREEKSHKRARNNSNNSDISNITSASTVTTETTTTTASNITNEDCYQDDITYSELLNNPMKKHEIYQMEKSHNKFIKSWLDFENKIYCNLNYFIENDFIDLYDFLCKKSDTINSNQNKNSEIPLP
ncbi:hypothetical protein BCR32DRAFT_264890 [Anaeromyces robustus]|uniref:Uncharacterized protein n=1 Tax=Anaeromyces robustus TaxID=1754192 RepID=A0A1Y1XL57_9FUNG|nr:hypothetical protein BCR32DRAFT_264890 [Anaeromyces robustus]|eukprot:ORX86499.1 hypothetical protein BCR32DRAFT_264890 [Anaeromyces robustus]